MINVNDLKKYIIQPPLHFLDLYSKSAENLLLGTMAVESELGTYLHQINGPALGPFQMEPNTYHDIWHIYLPSKKELARKIRVFFDFPTRPMPEQMIYNLRYAAAMCRVHYLRFYEKLPAADDIVGMAEYWKKYYNTSHGEGTVEKFIKNYKKYL